MTVLMLLAAACPAMSRADSTVVFNEVMYHPLVDEAELEWIELHNQMAVDMDVSDWTLAGGVDFRFPPGTIVPGGGFVIVAVSPVALEAASGLSGVLGPFAGRLDNSGERLDLLNNSRRLMDSVRYRDRGSWPVAPDGSGVSLAKLDPDSASAVPSNWAPSVEIGGTPGTHNFPRFAPPAGFPPEVAAYWSFDEASGAAVDPAGNNNGRLGRDVSRVEGIVGSGAVAFANTPNSFVNVGAGGLRDFTATDGIAIEALVVPTWSGESDDADMIFRKEDGENRILFGFQHDAETANRDVPIEPAVQPVLSFGINVGGEYSELDMPLDGQQGRPLLEELRDGRAHHLVAAYDGASGRKAIYIDGALAFGADLPPGGRIESGGGTSAYVGNMSGRAQPFSGVIDEVAFWTRALSAAEVAAHLANLTKGRDYFAVVEEPETAVSRLAFNETSVSGGADGWLEIVNHGAVDVELENHVIVTSSGVRVEQQYVLPAGTLKPAAFLTLTAADLGFALADGDKLFLYDPERSRVLDAVALRQGLQGREPEATGRWWTPSAPTPGATNRFDFHDEIVINEIMYHPLPLRDVDGVPFQESPEGWIELHNRGTAEVDLGGWRLDGGVDFVFPADTRLAPGGFLLVAADREYLHALHPDVPIAGNYAGRLSRRGERLVLRDAVDNVADEVHYQDRGRWPEAADGGGSSLELRDPDADNSIAEAWGPSDETEASDWRTYSYQGVARANGGPSQWNELVFGLLDAGEALVDDISVVEEPDGAALELLQNGDFEAGAASWRFLGTHGRSRVVSEPGGSQNRVLHLVATGPTEHMHNHVETTFANRARVINGREYRVSFRARWLSGSNQFHTRLYFNRLPRTTHLDTPARTGTPGRPNSLLVENIGPTFGSFRHSPVVPEANDDVTVAVVVSDPDGVDSCLLWWTGDQESWEAIDMAAGDAGVFTGTIPPQPRATVVQFHVEARDRAGAVSSFPAAGRDARALYIVDDGEARLGTVHNLRIVMTPSDTNRLYEITNLMSNDRLPCTVIYDEREVFYDVGVRMRGSERGRPQASRVGFNVSFHRDHLFRGVHTSVGIDRSGGWRFGRNFGQDEILIKHIAQHAGGIPGMYDDIVRVIAPRSAQTGSALLLMARFGNVFLDSQWENGSDGTRYTFELIYHPTSTTDGNPESLKQPLPDQVRGTDLRDLGDDKEVYRWWFLIENNEAADDYSDLMAFSKAMGSPTLDLETAVEPVMDIDQWMRAYALISLCGVGDIYTFGNNHNNMFWVRPDDGKVLLFPWDMDFAFTRGATSGLWGDQNLSRLVTRPGATRLFFNHVRDIVDRTYNSGYMSHWVTHYGDLAGQDYRSILNYIAQRGNFALTRVPREVEFAIRSNDGEDFTVEDETVRIDGDAWIDVRTVLVADLPDPPVITWVAVTRWRTTLPLRPGANEFTFLAIDAAGGFLASDSITVTRTSGAQLFIRGDADLSGTLSISDAVRTLFHLVRGQALDCEEAADSDGNAVLDLSDAVYLLNYLFKAGPAPPPPFPDPGTDPDMNASLGCERGLEA